MKISSKILTGSGIVLSIILCYSFTFGESKDIPQNRDTQERVHYEEAEKIALRYLEINKDDDLWKDNHPRLGETTPLFMEKNTPSYIEYEIICERNIDCGFIVVNIDGDDIDIPVASPSDIPPSKILTEKSGVQKQDLQFYYFSPFDIYSENQITGQINTINPQDDFVIFDEISGNMSDREKEGIGIEQKEYLEAKFQGHLAYWREYRDSENFRKVKENISKYTVVPFGNPGTEDKNGWIYVKGESSPDCNSRIPCYEQFTYNYGVFFQKLCKTGCSPVAAAMIFAYHDKENNYPDLFKNKIAPMKNSQYYWTEFGVTPKSVIADIREYMNTECTIDFRRPNAVQGGGTTAFNMLNGIQYAKNNGYPGSTSGIVFIQTQIFGKITSEIDDGRPLLININTKRKDSGARPDLNSEDTIWKTSGHTIVGYGYRKLPYINQVRINAGWGNGYHSNSNISLFNITNIDLSDSVYASEVETTIAVSVVWYKIQQ